MIGEAENSRSPALPANECELSRELKIAEDLARRAGTLLQSRQGSDLEIRYKANGEIVTPADLASNEIICHGLSTAFPEDGIYSEENQAAAMLSSAARVWMIDPLDSTSNYVQRGDEYSVSIGLAVRGQAVLGVVYNPARNEMFSGYRGYGACWNGIPVRTSFAQAPESARILVSSKEWKRGLQVAARNLRVQPMASMAYKLARVAAGREDAALSMKQRKPWGTCAGTALVLSAGGSVTSLDGELPFFACRTPIASRGLVAAGIRLHRQMLEVAGNLHSSMKARYSA
ncbi:MAG: inositol monophosphatase family protein [Actinomycetota bacterium]